MIQEVNGGYVISSRQIWRPGSYESAKAARAAQRLDDGTLQKLQDEANAAPERRITLAAVQREKKASKK